MDVILTWDSVFGILDAARKYMVEDACCKTFFCCEPRDVLSARTWSCSVGAGSPQRREQRLGQLVGA